MTRNRIPAQLIAPGVAGTGQWADGEGLDDRKMHRRIDVPLDQLSAAADVWGSDLNALLLTLPTGLTYPKEQPVPFSPLVDPKGTWDYTAQGYRAPAAGLYSISVSLSADPALSWAVALMFPQHRPAPIFINSGGSPSPAPAGAGPRLSIPIRLDVGEYFFVASSDNWTTSGLTNANWLAIQQLTWG